MNLEKIVLKITTAKKVLCVSREEIENAMIDSYSKKNSVGLKLLADTYIGWEVTGRKRGVTEAQARELALENLDFVANVADEHAKSGNLLVGLYNASNDLTGIGPIRKFYRTTLDYRPLEPIKN